MRTSVLILSILAAIIALSVGLCSGMCASGLGEWGSQLGDTASAAEARELSGQLTLMALVEFVMALVGGIMAYRSWQSRAKTRIGAVLLLIGAACSITNTFQALSSGILLLVAAILCFIGGGKKARPATQGQD